MKALFLISLFLLAIAIGCGDEVLDPEDQQYIFIDLPANTTLGDTTNFEKHYMMHGSYGTTIQFNRQFAGGPFGQYTISATMVIDSGMIAMTDSMMCMLSVGAKNTSAMISPLEQNFAHPFKLTLKYTGLDLQGLSLGNLQFVCTNGSDVTFDVVYDSITLDYVTGTLEVVNARVQFDPRIEPDSRYGWVRKAE
ncbi:MAG TPA: hypothetical protein VH917_05010 [Ignavibacteriaceae bacterium]|jgi:hypothetical protein